MHKKPQIGLICAAKFKLNEWTQNKEWSKVPQHNEYLPVEKKKFLLHLIDNFFLLRYVSATQNIWVYVESWGIINSGCMLKTSQHALIGQTIHLLF